MTQVLARSDIMPPKISRIVNYIDPSMLRTSLNSYNYFRFRANNLFDPDPLILSGQISGFQELATLYREYKVTDVEFEWNVVNRESFPVVIGVVYSTYDLATQVTSPAAALNTIENGFSTRAKILSAAGGMDRFCFKGKVKLAQLLGNPSQYDGDTDYGALVNAGPVYQLFVNFVVVSTTGASLTLGIVSGLTLRYSSKFFNRQNNLL